MPQQPIILFDGVCNFCNSTVNFIIKRDKKSVFRFAALQSASAGKILSGNSLKKKDFDSFVYTDKGRIYTKSSAALQVCRHLTGIWPLMYGFIIIPRFIRDAVYDLVAKNRYKWFGKKEACMIPAPEIRSRFLNETENDK